MRNPIAAARSRARHRGKTPARLRAANARLEADFDAAAIDYSGALEDLRMAREENARLRAAPAAWSEKEGAAS
ncbi:hypothetical protein [Streptomyces rimosus]|uniref:hypothetical protein n=1 Tax=Streptomyces rimosus TaxID=1927 RepID=UPI0004C4C49D|nr:hypothetical protein [Streptomyces rimosus]